MTDRQYSDLMESLQFAGHPVRWYCHARDRFSKAVCFHSRAIAETWATARGMIVTPDVAA